MERKDGGSEGLDFVTMRVVGRFGGCGREEGTGRRREGNGAAGLAVHVVRLIGDEKAGGGLVEVESSEKRPDLLRRDGQSAK